jgi:F0F1-type ATP synthase membrane subunit c/vacuolar-type H+-ATPase subunit K
MRRDDFVFSETAIKKILSVSPQMRENICQMSKALRTLRAVQWSMLASILVYTVLGELVGPRSRGVDPGLSYLFSTLAVGIVGTIFVVRRTLVQRAAASLAEHPDDSLSLGHWSTGYFVTYALCEALALFGLVLRFLGSPMQQSVLFYLGAFALLFFFRAREPVRA